jgi:hypothetical protein
MTTRKLGRQARSFNPTVPHMRAMRGTQQAPLPAALSWLHGMPADLGMMLNGPTPGDPAAPQLGDCTCAGLAHARQVWSYNASGQMVTLPDDYVLQLYERGCGYMLGNEATDQGGNEQSLLTFCQQTGIPTPGGPDKILGFVELNVANTDDIKRAIAEGGIVYLGINIPDAWCEAPVGSTWDVTDSPTAGGHAIIGAAYDPQELYVVSWGNTWPMTWAGFAQVCDEAYLVVDQAWLNAKGSTPFGMSLDALEAAMSALKA